MSIGSATSASLKLEQVAKRYAAIHQHRGRYFLKSWDRHNPVLVNGHSVAGSQWLKHGDILRFSSETYRFIDPDAPIRNRNRRLFQAAAAMLVIASVAAAHAEQWDRPLLAAIGRIARSNLASAPPDNKSNNRQLAAIASTPTAVPRAVATVQREKEPRVATSSPMPMANDVSGSGNWLDRINHFRTLAGLSRIHESPNLSASVDAHAHYLMANFADKLRGEGSIGNVAYSEDKDRKDYSPQGAEAAANSQIAWGCGIEDQAGQIDRWIAGPFHRLEMLSPTLQEAGFGEIAADGCWVAALRLPPVPDAAGPYRVPVMFPPDGAAVSLTYAGGEFPNPLAACPNYSLPTGLPITLQIGRVMEINLGAHSLTEDGRPVEECACEAKSYLNPDPGGQEYGRWALRSNGAVIMIPRAPLKPEAHYKVSIVANDRTYTWSFQAATDESAEGPRPSISDRDVEPSSIAASITRSPGVTTASDGGHHATAIPMSSAPEVRSLSSATAQPTVSELPETAGSSTAWLNVLNGYRAQVQSRPVAQDDALSHADLMHVRYLLANYGDAIGLGHALGGEMHQEVPGQPGFSPEGLKAGRQSDVVYEWQRGAPDGWAIEWWMATPFHRPQLLNPFLQRVGYANECRDKLCMAALDAVSGLTPMLPRQYDEPLRFPPDGSRMRLRGLSVGEWPNPIAPCPGFKNPAGMAVTLMLGLHVPATLSRYSIEEISGPNPGKLEACGYDLNTYSNSDQGSLSKAQDIMKSFGEVVLIPRNPLDAGAEFHVALTVNGKDYQWSFAIEPEGPDSRSQVQNPSR